MTLEVIINGIEYVPAPAEPPKPGVLDCVMGENDAGARTVRDYLVKLLETLWNEEEGFSGKRPFGNSGWCHDLYAPLVRAGMVSGKFDSDGEYLEEFDRPEADRQIALAILSFREAR